MNHTPGPWEARVVMGDAARYGNPESRISVNSVASWSLGPRTTSSMQAQADAALIAVAPDMYEVLKEQGHRAVKRTWPDGEEYSLCPVCTIGHVEVVLWPCTAAQIFAAIEGEEA